MHVKKQTAFYILSSFIVSHERAQKQIHLFDPASSKDPAAHNAIEAIVNASQQHVLQARKLLAELHKDTVLLVETVSSQLSEVLLEAERHYILHLTESEMLTQQEAHQLLKVRCYVS